MTSGAGRFTASGQRIAAGIFGYEALGGIGGVNFSPS
jgi:hypothetical protein